MKLNQPYYIEPRLKDNHLNLNKDWRFFGSDKVFEKIEDIDKSSWSLKTDLPKSIYHSLKEAGVLPDPYIGTNSKLYSDVDEKVWYYRKVFQIQKPDFKGNAFFVL